MSKTGHGTYNKFHFETCAEDFTIISRPIYRKAHGIMQIHQNKLNCFVLLRLLVSQMAISLVVLANQRVGPKIVHQAQYFRALAWVHTHKS